VHCSSLRCTALRCAALLFSAFAVLFSALLCSFARFALGRSLLFILRWSPFCSPLHTTLRCSLFCFHSTPLYSPSLYSSHCFSLHSTLHSAHNLLSTLTLHHFLHLSQGPEGTFCDYSSGVWWNGCKAVGSRRLERDESVDPAPQSLVVLDSYSEIEKEIEIESDGVFGGVVLSGDIATVVIAVVLLLLLGLLALLLRKANAVQSASDAAMALGIENQSNLNKSTANGIEWHRNSSGIERGAEESALNTALEV
jgi:hypothetical protein